MAVSCIYTNTIFGKVSGPSSASGTLSVRYVSTAEANSVTVTLYCHACKTVLDSVTFKDVEYGEERFAVFDISKWESSGHPGPYEFTPNGATGDAYVKVQTFSEPGAGGSTSGDGIYSPSQFGGDVSYTISARPNLGWKFDHWHSSGGADYTKNPITIGVRNVTRYLEYNYFAFFTKIPSFTINVVFLNPVGPVHKHGVVRLILGYVNGGVYHEQEARSFDEDASFVFERINSSISYSVRLSVDVKHEQDYPIPKARSDTGTSWRQIPMNPQYVSILSVASTETSRTIYIDWHCGALLCNQEGLLHKGDPASLVYCGESATSLV